MSRTAAATIAGRTITRPIGPAKPRRVSGPAELRAQSLMKSGWSSKNRMIAESASPPQTFSARSPCRTIAMTAKTDPASAARTAAIAISVNKRPCPTAVPTRITAINISTLIVND